MENPLTRKLEMFGQLGLEDKRALDALIRGGTPLSGQRTDVVEEGSVSLRLRVVLEGMAYRYKTIPNGSRQIVAFMLPGDFCGYNASLLGRLDHSTRRFARCLIMAISRQAMDEAMERPLLARAVRCAVLVDQAVAEEWLVNVGRRSAENRMAHLLCELCVRMHSIDLGDGSGFVWPGTQNDFADALGLSVVHVNRTLKVLRAKGFIELRNHFVTVNMDCLRDMCQFNPAYLHLSEPPRDQGTSLS